MSERVILIGSSLVLSVFIKVKKRIVERKNIKTVNKRMKELRHNYF